MHRLCLCSLYHPFSRAVKFLFSCGLSVPRIIRLPSHASDIHECNLDCLGPNAFDFPGARNVTTVNIQNNDFISLPEALLQNMSSLQNFHAQARGLWGECSAALLFGPNHHLHEVVASVCARIFLIMNVPYMYHTIHVPYHTCKCVRRNGVEDANIPSLLYGCST